MAMIFINTHALLYFVSSLFYYKKDSSLRFLFFLKKNTFHHIDFVESKLYSDCYTTSMRVATENKEPKVYVYT